MTVAYNTLNALLVRDFPELAAQYEHMKREWKDDSPGPHVTYGDIFVPHVFRAVRQHSIGDIKSACDFMELLATEGDQMTKELMEVTVCESIVDNEDIRVNIRPYLRRHTLALVERIEQEWGLSSCGKDSDRE